jgi:hypothetical protein
MPTPPVPFSDIKHTVEVYHQFLDEGWSAHPAPKGQPSALTMAQRELGFNPATTVVTANRLDIAVALGIKVREWRPISPEFADATVRRYHTDETYQAAAAAFGPPGGLTRPHGGGRRRAAPQVASPDDARPSGRTPTPTPPTYEELVASIVPMLRRAPLTLEQLAEKLQVAPTFASHLIMAAHAQGSSLVERNGAWHLDNAPAMGSQQDLGHRLVSDADGVIEFGAIGDTHLCSKYAREDCLNDFYDQVEHRGIKTVLHAGNWIDGEISFNRHDLSVHGMDPQMQYLAKNYPHRPGVETWAITGEDHEGWYSRREGIDVGRYAENVMRQNGRTDWVDLGFMETFVDLVHAGTDKSCKLLLMHPGGGSAYAISYQPQKIVESFDGGDKPAVLLLGHYHKASYNLIRNVHTVQVGAFQDQTIFMRKLKLSTHLGGFFVRLVLDPDTGAVVEFTTTFRNYFVRDYYRNRWSQHGPVEHAKRSA